VDESEQDEDQLNHSDEIWGRYDGMVTHVNIDSNINFDDYVESIGYSRCTVDLVDSDKIELVPLWRLDSKLNKKVEVKTVAPYYGDDRPKSVLNVTCESGVATDHRKEVKYRSGKSYFKISNKNNKFPELATLTLGGLAAMENKSEDKDTGADDGSVSYTSACYDSKSDAKDEAKDEAEEKAEDHIDSLIEDINASADDYLDSRTSSNKFCIAGYCVDNWFNFDEDPERIYVGEVSRDVGYDEGSTSTSECDTCAEDWECDENGFEHETDSSVSGICDNTDTLEYANCANNDYDSNWGCPSSDLTCDSTNNNSAISYYGRDTEVITSSEKCEPKNYPTPDCSDYQDKATTNYKYDLDELELRVKLRDEHNKIPAGRGDGFKHLEVDRTLNRCFVKSGGNEGVHSNPAVCTS
jgi:hypothetical protein